MERKRQICFRLPERVIKKMEEVRELTGMLVSNQIQMLLFGYRIVRISDGKEILGIKILRNMHAS